MTAATDWETLRPAVEQYRPEDVARMDEYWDAATLDCFSRELFGVGVETMVGMSPEALIADWREQAIDAAVARAEARGGTP